MERLLFNNFLSRTWWWFALVFLIMFAWDLVGTDVPDVLDVTFPTILILFLMQAYTLIVENHSDLLLYRSLPISHVSFGRAIWLLTVGLTTLVSLCVLLLAFPTRASTHARVVTFLYHSSIILLAPSAIFLSAVMLKFRNERSLAYLYATGSLSWIYLLPLFGSNIFLSLIIVLWFGLIMTGSYQLALTSIDLIGSRPEPEYATTRKNITGNQYFGIRKILQTSSLKNIIGYIITGTILLLIVLPSYKSLMLERRDYIHFISVVFYMDGLLIGLNQDIRKLREYRFLPMSQTRLAFYLIGKLIIPTLFLTVIIGIVIHNGVNAEYVFTIIKTQLALMAFVTFIYALRINVTSSSYVLWATMLYFFIFMPYIYRCLFQEGFLLLTFSGALLFFSAGTAMVWLAVGDNRDLYRSRPTN